MSHASPWAFSVQPCSMGALSKQKGERPLAASPMDGSGEVAQDEYNDQLKQIIQFHYLFRDFKAGSVTCLSQPEPFTFVLTIT